MVRVEPFVYQKTTAFKERVELANKLNEIIKIFNDVDIESKINEFNNQIEIINGKITQIDNALEEVNNAVQTVEGYNNRLTDVENESVSLDTRLNNIEPIVSNNTTKINLNESEINRILNGTVNFSGTKTAVDSFIGVKSTSPNFDEGSISTSGFEKVITQVLDSQNEVVYDMRSVRSATNSRIQRQIIFNKTTDNRTVAAYLDMKIDDTGVVSLLLVKTVNGVETARQTIANLTS